MAIQRLVLAPALVFTSLISACEQTPSAQVAATYVTEHGETISAVREFVRLELATRAPISGGCPPGLSTAECRLAITRRETQLRALRVRLLEVLDHNEVLGVEVVVDTLPDPTRVRVGLAPGGYAKGRVPPDEGEVIGDMRVGRGAYQSAFEHGDIRAGDGSYHRGVELVWDEPSGGLSSTVTLVVLGDGTTTAAWRDAQRRLVESSD